MKERPILFSGEMVRAILDGRKTQTRRECKIPWVPGPDRLGYLMGSDVEHFAPETGHATEACKHGQPGDRLWVKETFGAENVGHYDHKAITTPIYRATQPDAKVYKWKPSIFMPRWASRITLEITEVRVERLQDISEEDAWAEGVTLGKVATGIVCESTQIKEYVDECPSEAYERLWESINGTGSWAKNPWVWAISFKRV